MGSSCSKAVKVAPALPESTLVTRRTDRNVVIPVHDSSEDGRNEILPASNEDVCYLLSEWKENGNLSKIELAVATVTYSGTSVEELSRSLTKKSVKYLSDIDIDPRSLTLKASLAKAYAIFYWIANNIVYDKQAFLDGSVKGKDVSPPFVLRTKSTICSGYANLYNALASEADLQVVTIDGYLKLSLTHQKGSTLIPFHPGSHNTHAWNAVKLNEDDTWHLLDCTAASGSFTKEKFTKKYNHLYFAIPSTQLSYTHWPEDQHWQLLQHPLSLEEFRSQLPLSPEVFSLGIGIMNETELIGIGADSGDPVIQIKLKVLQGVQVFAKLQVWDDASLSDGQDRDSPDVTSANVEDKYRKYVFANRQGDVCQLFVAVPHQGTFVLKVYASNYTRKEWEKEGVIHCASYVIQSSNEASSYIGYPWVDQLISSKFGFQLIEWNGKQQHVAENHEGELKMKFKLSMPTARLTHFIAPSSGESNASNSPVRYHYYTSIVEGIDDENQNEASLHALFPSEGLWTLCLGVNEYDPITGKEVSTLLMQYDVSILKRTRKLSYPWVQSSKVKLIHNKPLTTPGNKVLSIPFITMEPLHFYSYITRNVASGEKFEQYAMVTTKESKIHELQVVFPEPGMWLVHTFGRTLNSSNDFISLFSLYFEVDECMPGVFFPNIKWDVMNRLAVELQDQLPLQVITVGEESTQFHLHLQAADTVKFETKLQPGWSVEEVKCDDSGLVHSHCITVIDEGSGCYKLQVQPPYTGRWNAMLYASSTNPTSSLELLLEAKFSIARVCSSTLFIKLFPDFTSIFCSKTLVYENLSKDGSFYLPFSVTAPLDFSVVMFLSSSLDDIYVQNAAISPTSCEGNQKKEHILQAMFPRTGQWILQVFASNPGLQEYKPMMQLLVTAFAIHADSDAGMVYPHLLSSFYRFGMKIHKQSQLLPSTLPKTPASLSIFFVRPQEIELLHQLENGNGEIERNATRITSKNKCHELQVTIRQPGKWVVKLFARDIQTSRGGWTLVFQHQVTL